MTCLVVATHAGYLGIGAIFSIIMASLRMNLIFSQCLLLLLFFRLVNKISVKVDFGGADGDMACFRFNELLQASICA